MFTHTTRAKCFRKKQRDFFTRQTRSISSKPRRRENEREKKRDEKKNTNRERSNRVRLPGPPLSISRHKYYKYYSLLSLTDKPAGAGDANLQLLLRPVRLGAVDPSQGVLLARGVRSFRISHSSRVIVSRCRVFVVGTKKEDNKKCSTSEEGTLFREHEKSTLALFPLLFALKKKAEEAEGREERVFFIFFCSSFSMHCSLFFLSLLFSLFLSLFSLKQLVCVFLLENSLHTNNFLAAAQSSNHHRNLSSLYKSKQQHAFRVLRSKRTEEQKQNAL